MPSITYIYIITSVKATSSKSIIFRVKNTFEPNVLKWVIKKKSLVQVFFPFLIINVKIISNFQKDWCTFGRKKDILKNKDSPFSGFECFEHAIFIFIFVKL
jgi:hypothetical protein